MLNSETTAHYPALMSVKSSMAMNLAWTASRPIKVLPQKFASLLAHEIRNPLTNISLSLEMLDQSTTSDEQKKYFAIIKRSYQRINTLLNSLLQCKDQAGDQGENISVQQLLDEVLEVTGDRIVLKHISVRKNYAAGDLEIKLDGKPMKIALTNIIINAIDAMPFGGGILQINSTIKNGQYAIEIEDNGCGITRERLQHIFQPYRSTKVNGTGIGLTLSNDIFKANGIETSIRSTEKKGTCFTLNFGKQPVGK